MNTNPLICDRDRIQLFLDHKLSDAELSTFESHLTGCDDCRRRLETAVASEDLWSEMRASLQDEQLPPYSPLPPGEGQGVRAATDSALDSAANEDALSSKTTVLNLLSPTDDDRMLGRWGAYEVVGVVGSGGMGVVLKALDTALNRYVAIKVLAPHLGSSGAARKRFSREAQASAAVVHDNVIEIYGVAEAAGLPYLVMPYVRGPSLQRRLDDEGPLAVVEILRVGRQAAAGLAAAHAQGLVHRDVKPANILLADGIERVKLTDFGLARAADDASLTRTGYIAGTPLYMSPEQARGEPVDQRSDLFSLGSVLYAMCTGRPPFRAETSYGVLRRITDEEPRPIREINPDIPDWLCGIVAKLMAKRPDDRFQSAGEVSALLEQCLAHVQQPTAVPLPQFSPLPPGEGQGVRVENRQGTLSNDHRDNKDSKDKKRQKRFLATAVALLFFGGLAAFGILIHLKKDNKTTTVEVPEGAVARIDPKGAVTVELPSSGAAAGTQPDLPTQEGIPGPSLGPPSQEGKRGPSLWPARPPQAPFVLSQAEIAAVDNLLKDWESRDKQIRVMESKFYRWRYASSAGSNVLLPPPDAGELREGELKFAAPDKAWMKVEAKDPRESEQWLCDGKSIFRWDYAAKTVYESIMPPEMQGKCVADCPVPFLFGIDAQKLRQRYFMRIITPSNLHYEVWLEAYPRFDAAKYRKVEVILQLAGEARTVFPFAIRIYLPNGKDRVVYQLQEPRINPRGSLYQLLGDNDWTKPSIPSGWSKRTTEYVAERTPATVSQSVAGANSSSLAFGPLTHHLQAALELKPAGGQFAFGQPIGVSFHIRNSSSKPAYTFLLSSAMCRDDDQLMVEDAQGRKIEVHHIPHAGPRPEMVVPVFRGETKVLRSASLAFVPEYGDAEKFAIGQELSYYAKVKPGRYSVRFRLHFPAEGSNVGSHFALETAPVTVDVTAGTEENVSGSVSKSVPGTLPSSGNGTTIPKGMRVIIVEAQQYEIENGPIVPNSIVDLQVVIRSPQLGDGRTAETKTIIIADDVHVFAVRDKTDAAAGSDKTNTRLPRPSVSLLVTPRQAETIATAAAAGTLRLIVQKTRDPSRPDIMDWSATVPGKLKPDPIEAEKVSGSVSQSADFELLAKGTLEAVEHKDIFADVDGTVAEFGRDADGNPIDYGSRVKKDQLLMRLSNPKLEAEEAKIKDETATERARYGDLEHELAASGSTMEVADKPRLISLLAESKEKLNGLEHDAAVFKAKIDALEVKCPINGQVVTWGLKQHLLGLPVHRNSFLLRVANTKGPWEIQLQMTDDRMGHVTRRLNELRNANDPNLQVEYIVSTAPVSKHKGAVKEIALLANPEKEEGNIVLIRVAINKDDVDPADRVPGVPVAGKVRCGKGKVPEAVASHAVPTSPNILKNSGVESGDETPDNWQQGAAIEGVKYSWCKTAAFEGKASLCIEKTAQRYFPIAQWSQTVDRQGDRPALLVSAQVKAEKMTKAILDVSFLDARGEQLSHQWAAEIGNKGPGMPPANHDWKLYSGKVQIPPQAKKLCIGLQVYGPGKVWFDDIRAGYVDATDVQPNDGKDPLADVADVPALERRAGGDAKMRYFLIGASGAKAPPDGFGLLVVLPGGDGSADFQPFVRRIYKNALDQHWLIAQAVAPQWDEKQFEQIVWPTAGSPYPAAKFTTEQFIEAIVGDVRAKVEQTKGKIDPKRVFVLGWSSGGPPCYAAALRKDSSVRGALIAMSVFKPGKTPVPDGAKGKAFYLLHSPDDRVVPIRFAVAAEKALGAAGAKVRLEHYDGGHGWRGDVFQMIGDGIKWLDRQANAAR